MSSFDRRLSQTLKRAGCIDDEQLQSAIAEATRDNASLFEVLVKSGQFEERELLGTIAVEAGVTPIDLDHVQLDPEVLEILPQDAAEKHRVFPVAKIGDVLTLAVTDPFDVVGLDDLRRIAKSDLRVVIASERALKAAIDRGYRRDAREMEALVQDATSLDDLTIKDTTTEDMDDVDLADVSGETSPVVMVTNKLIIRAVKDGASDIHLEPFEQRVRVRYRQDGVLHEAQTLPKSLAASVASRVKIMAGLDIAEKRKPQDGKFQVKLEGRSIDFRVSTLPVVHGEKVVMRVLDNSNLVKGLDSLGFEAKCLSDFRDAIAAPYGMILITGPTGSGKSTTLYSSVKELYSEETNFVTVEDPVEYQLDGINQVPVNPKRGVTFAGALRSILRQDPDVILIGEIRDSETVEIAVKAAMTGHLVLSTLHTNDAASAVTRMVDMGLDPFHVASSVVLVAAQRLCRKLCTHCREPITLPPERLAALGFPSDEVKDAQLYKAVGCVKCHQGYKGRFAVLETLKLTDAVKAMILAGKSSIEIKKKGVEEGMITLRHAAALNALRGRTSVEEVCSVTMADEA